MHAAARGREDNKWSNFCRPKSLKADQVVLVSLLGPSFRTSTRPAHGLVVAFLGPVLTCHHLIVVVLSTGSCRRAGSQQNASLGVHSRVSRVSLTSQPMKSTERSARFASSCVSELQSIQSQRASTTGKVLFLDPKKLVHAPLAVQFVQLVFDAIDLVLGHRLFTRQKFCHLTVAVAMLCKAPAGSDLR